jgi:uncharacterized metal-binding protein/predicted Fe-Mo cluster-binding NifX family protein
MHWGVLLIGDRVAPRCTRADGLLLARVNRGRVVSHARVGVAVRSPVELLDAVIEHEVEKLVCGGISREVREALAAQDVAIVENVACSAGEVLAALSAGSLCSGYGFGPLPRPAAEGAPARAKRGPAHIDCLACRDRLCLGAGGGACPGVPGAAVSPPPCDLGHLLEAATDIAREEERTLCRVTELVYLCLEMQFERVGIAFCKDLLEPTRILAGVLRRFFEVVPVWCKIGGGGVDGVGADDDGSPCNPLGQAAALNAAGTHINVVVGLCIGADCVFGRASEAPVTHLFVKDRSLANNPIGALYSEHYLSESTHPTSRRGVTDQSWPARLRAVAGDSVAGETRS